MNQAPDPPEIGFPFVIKVHLKPDGRMPFRDKTNRIQGDLTALPELAAWVRKMAAGKPVLYLWARRERNGLLSIYNSQLPQQKKGFEQFEEMTA
jgi:hypothetical protein